MKSLLRFFAYILVAIFQVTLFGLLPTNFTQAAVPKIISYQSRLRTSALTAITSATSIQFSLYASSSTGAFSDVPSPGGPLLWKEVHDGLACPQVSPDADGYFYVPLGSCTAFPAYLDFNQPLYLGVKVGADVEAAPRAPIGAAPYALNAGTLSGYSASTNGGANTILVTDGSGSLDLNTGSYLGGSVVLSSSTANNLIAGNLTVSGTLNLANISVPNVTSTSWLGFATASGTSLSALNITANTVSVLGGSINNTIIGNLMPVGASFTTVTATTIVVNNINLSGVGSATTSGAYAIGIYDQFSHSNATSVQEAIFDLDQAISNVGTSTLDQAYRVGGAGGSRVISVDGGSIEARYATSVRSQGIAGFLYSGSFSSTTNEGFDFGVYDSPLAGQRGSFFLFSGDKQNWLTATNTSYISHDANSGFLTMGNLGGSNLFISPNAYQLFAANSGLSLYSDTSTIEITGKRGVSLRAENESISLTADSATDPNGALVLSYNTSTGQGLRIMNGGNSATLSVGFDNPENNIQADHGSVYLRTNFGGVSGTQLYVKTTNSTSTGWVGVATVDMLASAITSTLQLAYDAGGSGNGNVISMTTGKPIQLTNLDGTSESAGLQISDTLGGGLSFNTFGNGFEAGGKMYITTDVGNATAAPGGFLRYDGGTTEFVLGVNSGVSEREVWTTNGDGSIFTSHVTSTATLKLRNQDVGRNRYLQFGDDADALYLTTGNGSPEGVELANTGSLYLRTGGISSGTQLYVKTTNGVTNGWRGIATVDMLTGVATNTFIQSGNTFGADAELGTKDNFGLKFLTNGIQRGSIAVSGRWALGPSTTTVSHALNVQAVDSGILAGYTNTGSMGFQFTSTGGLQITDSGYTFDARSASALRNMATSSPAFANFQTNGALPTMAWLSPTGDVHGIVTAAGRFGLGTATPSTTLVVNGTSTMQDVIPASPYTGNVSGYNLGSTTTRWANAWIDTLNLGPSTWSVKQSSNRRFSLFDRANGAGSEALTILSNGSLGVGNTNPQAAVQITRPGANPASLILGNQSTADFRITAEDGMTAVEQDALGVGSPLRFLRQGRETMRLTSSGLVGLGTDTPSARFQVAPFVDQDPIGRIDQPSPYALDVQGRYAYIVNRENDELRVVDLTRPEAPFEVGRVTTDRTPIAIQVRGQYAYVASLSDSALDIFDISKPSSPTFISRASLSGRPYDVAIAGKFAFVSTESNEIESVDISDPANMNSVTRAGTCAYPEHIAVRDRYVFVACLASNEIRVYDAILPHVLTEITRYSLSTPARIVLQGRYAYVTSSDSQQLYILDVADPTNITEASRIEVDKNPLSLRVQGNMAYVGSFDANVIDIIDVTDPMRPVFVGRNKTGKNPMDIVVQGRYGYVVVYSGQSLEAFDLGAAYAEHMQAGTIESGTVMTREMARIGGDLEVKGNTTLGGSTYINGAFSVNANRNGGGAIFTIDHHGSVGIGTESPDQLFSVNGDASKIGGGTWQTFSDQRLKTGITSYEEGLDIIRQINPVRFKYNGLGGLANTSTEYIGVIAQDMERIAPYTVGTTTMRLHPNDTEKTMVYTFDPNALTYALINSVKELDKKVGSISGGGLTESAWQERVGQAKMLPGSSQMRVRFTTPFTNDPIVTATPIGLFTVEYGVNNITKEGFDLELRPEQSQPVIFNWIALGASETQGTASDGTTYVIGTPSEITTAPNSGIEIPPLLTEIPSSTTNLSDTEEVASSTSVIQ